MARWRFTMGWVASTLTSLGACSAWASLAHADERPEQPQGAAPAAALPEGAVQDPWMPEATVAVSKALGLKTCRVVPVHAVITPAGVVASATTGELALEVAPGTFTTFALEPYALRTSDFRVMVDDGTGPREVAAPESTTFYGRSAAGDEVWASVYQGQVSAVIERSDAPAERLYVQPVPASTLEELGVPGAGAGGVAGAAPTSARALHAVYAASDVLSTDWHCGVETPEPPKGEAIAEAPGAFRGPGVCRYVRLNVDCDFPMYQQSGYDLGAAVRSVESVMLGVNQVYLAAPFSADIRFTIPQITIRTSSAEPYASVPPIGGSISTLLNLVTSTWPASGTRDLTHLFSGRDAAGSTVGLAWLGTVCASFGQGVSETYTTSVLSSRIQLTAHEIGHNFNMNHDASGAPFIMAPSISSPGQTAFSAASVTSLNGYLSIASACATSAVNDVQADAATTIKNRPVRIDVLANDGRTGISCPTTVTSFTLPASATALGGSVALSPFTGPGGRNEVLYTPPANVDGVLDSFNYVAAGVTMPVKVDVQALRAPEGQVGFDTGLDAVYYETRPNGVGSYWLWDSPPTDYSGYSIFATTILNQLNYAAAAPIGFSRGLTAVITGYVFVPTSGYWKFTLSAGSSARMSLGSSEFFLLAPASAAGADVSAMRALQAGLHQFKVEYHWGPGTPRLMLSYNLEGQPSTVVPVSAFFRTLGTGGCNRADITDIGDSGAGADGQLTVDDLIAFVNAFSDGSGCPAPTAPSGPACNVADITDLGDSGAGPDGQLTVDDLIAFVNAFSEGC